MTWTFLYVAALYFAGIWVLRRWYTQFPWRVAVLFYLLVVVLSFGPMVLDTTDIPENHMLDMYPWAGFYKAPPRGNPETNDVMLQIVPWAHQVRQSWKKLEAPLWNDAAGGGYPLLANAQSSALAPVRIASLPLNLAESFACEAALKLLMALTFTYLYIRRRNPVELACILGAVSFAFSTFFLIWLHFPLASVAAFFPMLFLALDLVLERPTYRRILFVALSLTLLLLHGHPETTAHSVFIGSLYVLFRLATDRRTWNGRLKQIGSIAVAGLLAILLSLPFLLPFLEALPRSKRYELIQEQDAQESQWAEAGPMLVTFLMPRYFGSVRDGTLWGPGTAEFISGYAGIIGVVGLLALLINVVRKRRWREEQFFWVCMSLLMVVVVIETPGVSHLLDSLPVYSLAANGRLRFAVCWFLALCAAELVRQVVEEKNRRDALSAIAIVAVLLVLPLILFRFSGGAPLRHSLQATGIAALLLLSLLWFVVTPSRRSALALVGFAVLDLAMFGWYWYPDFRRKDFYPVTPLIANLQWRSSPGGPDELRPHRMTGATSAFFPNIAAVYGLQDIRAHDPMSYGRVLGTLRVFTGYTSDAYFSFLRNLDDPFLDYLNVRYVVSSPHEDYRSDRFVLVYSGPDGRIYQNRYALPRFYAARNVFSEFDDVKRTQMIVQNRDWANSVVLKRLPSEMMQTIRSDLFKARPPDAPVARVDIRSATPSEVRMSIRAPRWTLIISSQPNWPGWKIYRGAERLKQIEINGAFMGFLVPPGPSEVRVIYAPRSFSVSVVVSLGTLAFLIAGLIGSRIYNQVRERRAREAHP